MSEVKYRAEILFGSVELESRMRQDGDAWIGEGRRIERDMHGRVTKTTPWEPTGVELRIEPEQRPWWKFW